MRIPALALLVGLVALAGLSERATAQPKMKVPYSVDENGVVYFSETQAHTLLLVVTCAALGETPLRISHGGPDPLPTIEGFEKAQKNLATMIRLLKVDWEEFAFVRHEGKLFSKHELPPDIWRKRIRDFDFGIDPKLAAFFYERVCGPAYNPRKTRYEPSAVEENLARLREEAAELLKKQR